MTPSTRLAMDRIFARGCGVEGCGHDHGSEPMFIHQRCHPGAGLEASYAKGVVVIACLRCKSPIVSVKVAEA